MEHINDYVKWRGDITFEDRPFCDIDNLVLCQFSYLDIPRRFTEESDVTITGIVNMMREEAVPIRKKAADDSDRFRDFISKLASSTRFGTLEVHDFEDVIDRDKDVQFSAMTITGQGICAVVFRGTDDTVVAWKEDFMICFTEPKAQKYAAFYLARAIKRYGGDTIVCGHSKGGNTALVSALMTTPMRRKKIRMIYSNDGPGLRRRELMSKEYKSIRSKYKHIVPQNSIVGMMLRQDENFVVHSNQFGVLAHIPSSWEVIDDKLRRSVLSSGSEALNKALVEWLDKHSDEERLSLVNECFDLLVKSGINWTMDFRDPKKVMKAISMINTVPEDTRKLVLDVIKSCADRVSEATIKNKNK